MSFWPCLLAQQSAPNPLGWLGVLPWFAWIAIVAIVSGCVTGIITTLIQHRERMAMIQMGMHPDAKPPAEGESKPYAREAADL
jgi:hypothetical protein